jgi:hypothetical protein
MADSWSKGRRGRQVDSEFMEQQGRRQLESAAGNIGGVDSCRLGTGNIRDVDSWRTWVRTMLDFILYSMGPRNLYVQRVGAHTGSRGVLQLL